MFIRFVTGIAEINEETIIYELSHVSCVAEE